MNELILAVDPELMKSLQASARSKVGCHVQTVESEWRQELKELVDTGHGGNG